MVAFLVIGRKRLVKLLRESMNIYSLIALAAILAFFLAFALIYVSPTEQLYFDENIYQGIALNILNHGNALWCQFGSGYVRTCFINAIYHDPVGWSAFVAIAFAVAGIGTQTAYGLELLVGALSIVFAFLLASVLFKRKETAVVSALAMALMPGLFIWSRTQADFDLPFMMLATLSFFLFVVMVRRKDFDSLAAFAFSLALVSYMRLEAILLVPIFALLAFTFGESGIVETAKERYRMAISVLTENTKVLLLLLVFMILLLPEVYYIAMEAQNPSYGQAASQSVLSLENFKNNIATNAPFLLGSLNGLSSYPTEFHYTIFPLAVLGIAVLALARRTRNRFGILLLLILWFLAYFLFYTSFYAGSVLFGVDSRFMLQILPPLCLLASAALVGISDASSIIAQRFGIAKRRAKGGAAIRHAVLAVLAAALLIYPFFLLIPVVSVPPSSMPQQSVILPAITSFYENYSEVPSNCLVFSFTPDIWQEENRSSAQIGFLLGANQSIKSHILNYSCLAFDYGYWCLVPPYSNTTCSYVASHYKLGNFTSPPTRPNGTSVAFYKILNYT
jgi:hypothetical protein